MNIYDLMNLVVSAVADDGALKVACQDWYGADQRVFIDCNRSNPPDPADGPIIQFHSPGMRGGEEQRDAVYEFFASVDIYDNALAERSEDNVVEFSGTARLHEVIKRVKDDARAAVDIDGWYLSIEIETNTIDLWPILTGDVHFLWRRSLVIGEDPLDF